MASVRSLDNALQVNWGTDSAPDWKPITQDNGDTKIPINGLIMRNLIEGADLVMSHITHFYQLSALDFVDASALGPFFAPTYTTQGDMIPASFTMANGATVKDNYVQALDIRRKCHVMGAILSGRQPIQNAIVPGGVTTIPTASEMAQFDSLLTEIRSFINTAYIPDVITVAVVATGLPGFSGYTKYWQPTGSGNVISYGIFPTQTQGEKLLIARGVASLTTLLTATNITPTALLNNIVEDTTYSYYNNTAQGLHPHVGQTNPDVSKVVGNAIGSSSAYSWLKAPRYDDVGDGTGRLVCEVGPLARMVVSYLNSSNLATASATLKSPTQGPYFNTLTTYNANNIVAGTVTLLNAHGLGIGNLFSTFGRHAARAIECKLVADAMAVWSDDLQNNVSGGGGLSGPTYIYAKLPTKPAKGSGWTEAPRGALGHWITIDKKKIVNYQCVVPSTWNHSPMDSLGQHGPAEQVLKNQYIGTGNGTDEQIVNIIRALHPFDFCIACAVHVVKPDGSTIAKFKLDTDGKVTKLPIDAEI